jgi:hypothetical protein
MPRYNIDVTFTTEEEDPAATCVAVANVLNSIPESIGIIETSTITSEDGTVTVDLNNVPIPRPPVIQVAGAQSVAPPASGPQSVDPDNPPEHSLPTGKEF